MFRNPTIDRLTLQELMEGGDLRKRNRELDDSGRRLFGWYQR
jgi:hypothetical protein